MSCLEGLLRDTARDLEPRIRDQMRGFFGSMVRHYLPQTWVFRTEQETVSLRVDATGAVAVSAGALAPADVTVEVGHDRLRAALTTRSHGGIPPGPLTVTPHTAKGKAAFGYLRDRIGL